MGLVRKLSLIHICRKQRHDRRDALVNNKAEHLNKQRFDVVHAEVYDCLLYTSIGVPHTGHGQAVQRLKGDGERICRYVGRRGV